MNNIEELKKAALDGVSDEMLLGGWTAKGISDYAKLLETKNFDLVTQLEAAQKRIAELDRDAILPGVMRCADCGFTLNRVSLNFGNGTVTAGSNEIAPCPNGCGPLHPDTWKRSREELCAQFNTADAALSAANEKLNQVITDDWNEIGPTYPAHYTPVIVAMNGVTQYITYQIEEGDNGDYWQPVCNEDGEGAPMAQFQHWKPLPADFVVEGNADAE